MENEFVTPMKKRQKQGRNGEEETPVKASRVVN